MIRKRVQSKYLRHFFQGGKKEEKEDKKKSKNDLQTSSISHSHSSRLNGIECRVGELGKGGTVSGRESNGNSIYKQHYNIAFVFVLVVKNTHACKMQILEVACKAF